MKKTIKIFVALLFVIIVCGLTLIFAPFTIYSGYFPGIENQAKVNHIFELYMKHLNKKTGRPLTNENIIHVFQKKYSFPRHENIYIFKKEKCYDFPFLKVFRYNRCTDGVCLAENQEPFEIEITQTGLLVKTKERNIDVKYILDLNKKTFERSYKNKRIIIKRY